MKMDPIGLMSFYVYDDKHLIVLGYDATIKKGIYKIINIKK